MIRREPEWPTRQPPPSLGARWRSVRETLSRESCWRPQARVHVHTHIHVHSVGRGRGTLSNLGHPSFWSRPPSSSKLPPPSYTPPLPFFSLSRSFTTSVWLYKPSGAQIRSETWGRGVQMFENFKTSWVPPISVFIPFFDIHFFGILSQFSNSYLDFYSVLRFSLTNRHIAKANFILNNFSLFIDWNIWFWPAERSETEIFWKFWSKT